MKKFTVMSRAEARKTSFKQMKEKTIIVSITDVVSEKNRFNRQSNLIGVCDVKFDDVEKGGENCITKNDAMKIIDFIDRFYSEADHIIVHCEAGVSRSAGACAAIMLMYDGNDMPIFENPKFCPNMTVYRTIIEAFQEKRGIPMRSAFEEEIIEKEKINIEVWKKENDI